MDELTYRRATPADITDLVALRVEFLCDCAQQSNYPLELPANLRTYFEREMAADRFGAWLCLAEGVIAGTSGICYFTVPPGFSNVEGTVGYIMNMYTRPGHRRKGIASQLFERLIADAKARNVRKLILHATNEGEPVYAQYGFEKHNDEMICFI